MRNGLWDLQACNALVWTAWALVVEPIEFAWAMSADLVALTLPLERTFVLSCLQPSAIGNAFASHPPIPDRVKAIREELRQMGY